jgi:membrane associated rhomboid family serine protease
MRPPQSWKTARVTAGIAILTAAAFVLAGAAGLQDLVIYAGGFIPARAASGIGDGMAPFWLTPLTATLIHAGWIHLGFNLLIHVFCGRSVEAVIGPVGFILLYLVGAYAAAGAHYLVDPSDPTPMVGASGAISAVLGAYALLFGRNRVKVANPTAALWLNALWLMAAWVVLQLILQFTVATGGVNVAIAAHIGGFLAGLALANPLLLLRYRSA